LTKDTRSVILPTNWLGFVNLYLRGCHVLSIKTPFLNQERRGFVFLDDGHWWQRFFKIMDVAYLYLLQFWGELSPPQPLSPPLAGGDKACPPSRACSLRRGGRGEGESSQLRRSGRSYWGGEMIRFYQRSSASNLIRFALCSMRFLVPN
jgi:hypothetical protein